MNFTIKDENQNGTVRLTEETEAEGVLLLHIDVEFPQPQVPQKIALCWQVPCVDICSVWGPGIGFSRFLGYDWSKRVSRSRFAGGAPFYSLISHSDLNRMTVVVSDAETPLEFASGVREETAEIQCELRLFTQPINEISSYHATVRFDTRPIRYDAALKDATRFLTEQCSYQNAYVPTAATYPMYSCWYSFHQNLNVEEILRQCQLGKAMGMDAVIVDDGWQTDDSQRGYAYCGDWEVCHKKIPDMKEFVDRVHQCGMKFILWYSVPFVGIHSKVYERFSDMFLNGTKDEAGKDWSVLDPRYPEVRQFLTDIYVRAKKEWGLDGFKLDFIDMFQIFPQTKSFDPRWDTLSLEDGVDKLLADVTTALREIDPEILIEFRQNYYGPAIRKYGNMIRVRDCPNDPLINHVHIADLRMISADTPIHSDMLMWHEHESAEAVAYQIICCLYSVPQISVLLDRLSDEHRKLLKFWMNYWIENREILLFGSFTADAPEHLYAQERCVQGAALIATAYTDPILKIDEQLSSFDFINATKDHRLWIDVGQSLGKRSYIVYDCRGNELEKGQIDLSVGIHGFVVPRSGMLRIFKYKEGNR